MPYVDIICLANSRKHGGRCVAGLRMDGGGWVRPADFGGGPLYPQHYTLDDGTPARVLDHINVPLDSPDAAPFQPENWVVGCGKWKLVSRPVSPGAIPVLRSALVRGPELLGSAEENIPLEVIRHGDGVPSLALIYPQELHWKVGANHEGERRVRAVFTLGGATYHLPLTDPEWVARLCKQPDGEHEAAEFIAPGERLLLTVSLGEPYGPRNLCYKLVAAVIVIRPEWLHATPESASEPTAAAPQRRFWGWKRSGR